MADGKAGMTSGACYQDVELTMSGSTGSSWVQIALSRSPASDKKRGPCNNHYNTQSLAGATQVLKHDDVVQSWHGSERGWQLEASANWALCSCLFQGDLVLHGGESRKALLSTVYLNCAWKDGRKGWMRQQNKRTAWSETQRLEVVLRLRKTGGKNAYGEIAIFDCRGGLDKKHHVS